MTQLRLLPAREFPLDEDSCREFRRRYRTRFEGDPTRSAIYRGLRQNIAPPGIEFYLPLFFDTTATLLRLPAAESVLVTAGGHRRPASSGLAGASWRGMRTAPRHRTSRCSRRRNCS